MATGVGLAQVAYMLKLAAPKTVYSVQESW